MFAALIALTVVVAVADWWVAATGRTTAERVLKPLTMLLLIGATLALPDPSSTAARWLILAALCCSLIGDVCLLFEARLFLYGLVAFLFAHIAYAFAMVQLGVETELLGVGLVVVLIASAVVGRRVVAGVRENDPKMTVPVMAYLTIISLMVVAAIGTGNPWAIVGALLFYASDGCIGWNRFVSTFPGRNLIVMSTYHLGQIGLVLALLP